MEQVALILAGGSGTRFGADKRRALLPDGRHVLCATLQSVSTAFDRWFLILRADRDEALATEFAIPEARILMSANAARGMGSSLADGIRQLPAGDCPIFVLLADMPWLRFETLDCLQDAARLATTEKERWILRPRNEEGAGHPVVFSPGWRRDLEQLGGDRGARDLIRSHRSLLRFVDVDDPGIHADIDAPEDLGGRQPP